jgi:hypothetical protein
MRVESGSDRVFANWAEWPIEEALTFSYLSDLIGSPGGRFLASLAAEEASRGPR